MKIKLLLSLFLLLFTPVISSAVVTHTLEIGFAFTPSDDPAKQITGYNVYKEGEKVTCENESDPNASSITCNFYSPDGTFNFTLTATYSDGTESPPSPSFPFALDSSTVTPLDPPKANISPETMSGTAPLTVNFNSAGSTGENLSYSWSFGDGRTSTEAAVNYIYTIPGTYYPSLTVTNAAGNDTVTATIIVSPSVTPQNKEPVAVISYAMQGENPLAIRFDGSQSSDPDGNIVQYSWGFGDGSIGSGRTISHTYSSPGDFTVSLVVTDNEGATAQEEKTVSCKTDQPEPVVHHHPPIYLQMVYNLIYLKR